MLYGVIFAAVEVHEVGVADEARAAAGVCGRSRGDSFGAEQRCELKQNLKLLCDVGRSACLIERAECSRLRLVGLSSFGVSELTIAIPERAYFHVGCD